MACFVGIDGCRAGWFTVSLFDDQSWELRVFLNIEEIWNSLSHAKLLLIDIPIGIRDEGPEERICDVVARQLLGQPRASSVFPPPARPALDYETREEASEVNRSLTGRRIGVQTWGIVPKIREVDQFLRTTPEAKEVLDHVLGLEKGVTQADHRVRAALLQRRRQRRHRVRIVGDECLGADVGQVRSKPSKDRDVADRARPSAGPCRVAHRGIDAISLRDRDIVRHRVQAARRDGDHDCVCIDQGLSPVCGHNELVSPAPMPVCCLPPLCAQFGIGGVYVHQPDL